MGPPLDTKEEQVREVLDRFYEEYPGTDIALEFSNRLELLVAVMLSAQCTDKRVNETTDELFERYHTAEDYANADEDELNEVISSITYHNSKAGYLKGIGELLVEKHDGEVPDTMEELQELPGVGRKTANVVLQHAHDVVEGIAVDTHVRRISRRLGLTEEENPDAIERDLLEIVPEDDWRMYTHLFIRHGRATCTARNPECDDCVVADICPSEKGYSEIDLYTGEPW